MGSEQKWPGKVELTTVTPIKLYMMIVWSL
jgi:hypothetical protein